LLESVDVVVVGGGPGGYPAAALLARAGLRVALVERHLLGGECTNYGCIPTKAAISRLSHARLAGAQAPSLEGLAGWALDAAAARSREGVRELLARAGVWVVEGDARIAGPGLVEVEGGPSLRAERAVLAAPGTLPSWPPGLEPDEELVVTNRGFFQAIRRGGPASALVVGGGPVGVEYATILAMASVEVTLVELMPRLLPGMDRSLSQAAEASLRRLGVRVARRATARVTRRGASGVEAEVSGLGAATYDLAVVATGRRPATRGLGLERAGARLDERGFAVVERPSMMAAPGLYVAGDAAGPPLLAHKAFHESIQAAEAILGSEPRPMGPVPVVVYTHPEVASVGMTLEEAAGAGFEAAEARVPVGALARVWMEGGERGFVKLVYDASTHRLLGFHASMPGAGELAAHAAALIAGGATLEDVAASVHPHPTLSEALWEAALAALGRGAHVARASTRRLTRRG
jgi:dihydrolipoamide dehydrogenase